MPFKQVALLFLHLLQQNVDEESAQAASESGLSRLVDKYQELLQGDFQLHSKKRLSEGSDLGGRGFEIGTLPEGQLILETHSTPVAYDYVELQPTAFLSVTASLTPFSNHNQSPR